MLSFVLVFGLVALLNGLQITMSKEEIFLNIALFLFISIANYLICFIYPRSYWYVPILCNLSTIISAMIEPIQLTFDWYYIMGGWALSLIAALAGAWMGRRKKPA